MISWNDRRKTKFKSPQVEALAKASAAGARGIRATDAPAKDPSGWQKHDAEMERASVHREARDIQAQYNTSRGSAYETAARRVDRKGK